MYEGYAEITNDEMASIYEGNGSESLYTNQYVISESGEILRYDGEELVDLRYPSFGKDFRPKNAEQRMAFDLMSNSAIPIKELIGVAGSGKTKLGLAFGLRALQKGHVKKLFIVRQPSPVGEDIGFLPGEKDEKLEAWFKPIIDNLEGGEFELASLRQKGMIEFEAPAFMQGRDLQDTAVVVDEAQLLTVEQVKMLGSRIGEGSTITFCGDYDQVFNRKYAGEKNGLVKLADTFAGYPEFGVIHLQTSVRGKVAEMFATKM
ncbi:hypothetical protein D7Z54_32865 [Salibacterium salarium]|uniref:PhoH-like protein domain-containing protein n=1 Tax=Salibacterium salarium TaxID=284579 RepID=A0A428MSM0_9BACI|nr:PhoH family protein [Salibacterium salarium]RSL29124.1 hypothetical protein D7Z54_32865 [Salibacterium salarium]